MPEAETPEQVPMLESNPEDISDQYAQEVVTLAERSFHADNEPRQHWEGISIYDTAHLLRLPDGAVLSHEQREDIFEKIVLEGSREKGYWGDASITPHSALLDTLGVLYLLYSTSDYDQFECVQNSDLDIDAIKGDAWRAVNELYIESSADKYPKHETVAIEQLVVLLTEHAALSKVYGTAEGLYLDPQERVSATLGALDEEAKGFYKTLKKSQAKKMELMKQLSSDKQTYFPPDTTAAYTLEALEILEKFGAAYDANDLAYIHDHTNKALGGVALSPAATVAAINLMERIGIDPPKEHYEYLELALDAQGGQGVAGTWPFRITNTFWPVLMLHVNGDSEVLRNEQVLNKYSEILKHEFFGNMEKGAPWDIAQTIGDVDDAVAVLMQAEELRSNDRQTYETLNYTVIENNFCPDGLHYICYEGEMSTSPSHLYHLLFYLEKILINANEGRTIYTSDQIAEVETMRDKCLVQLRDVISTDPFSAVDDKWYTGEGYGLHRLFSSDAMVYQAPELVSLLIDRFEDLQNREGSQGGFGTHRHQESIVEESIYVYTALHNLQQKLEGDLRLQNVYGERMLERVDSMLNSVEGYLLDRAAEQDYGQNDPPLWIGKTVYNSLVVKASAVANFRRIYSQRQTENIGHKPINPLNYEIRELNETKKKLMANTEKLWANILVLGKGERDHGYARNARVIGHHMIKGTGVDVYYTMPASSDPPAFNKISEMLAEEGPKIQKYLSQGFDVEAPDLNQSYTDLLVFAANPENWEQLAEDNPDFGVFERDLQIAESVIPGLGEIMKQSAVHIALIGKAGRESLVDNVDPDIQTEWENLYEYEVIENYKQELDKGLLLTGSTNRIQIPAEEMDASYGDYEFAGDISDTEFAIVERYLEELGKTSALGVALVGGLAHLPPEIMNQEMINFLETDAQEIFKISRLVQDAKSVDPTERDNVGMRLLREMRGLPIDKARDLLKEGYFNEKLAGFRIKDTVGNERRENISKRLIQIYEKKYLEKFKNMLKKYNPDRSETERVIVQLIRNQLEVNGMILQFKEDGILI